MNKNAKKVSIQSRRRLFFLRPICIFAVIFLIITLVSDFYRLYQLNNEKKKKEEEYVKLQEESEYLKNEITKLNNPEEIAKFARENYSYSKDGEIIVKINEQKEKEEDKKTELPKKKVNNNMYVIIGGSLVIIFFISSLIKRKDSE